MSDNIEQCSKCYCNRETMTSDGLVYLCYKNYPDRIVKVDRQAICRFFKKRDEGATE